MRLRSDEQHWGTIARTFHWLIALGIVAQGALGLTMVELPKRPNVIPIYNLHKSIGLTLLVLVVLRLLWRLFDPHPLPPAGMPRWQAVASRIVHGLLYALILAAPISGWLFDSASSLRPLFWFGLVKVPSLTGGPNPALKQLTHTIHLTLFWTIVVVAAGHAAAALKHHWIDRDEVLARMLPWRSRSPTPLPRGEGLG